MSTNLLHYDELPELDDLLELLWTPYLRVSFDKSGRLRSPAEQLGDLGTRFERRAGWSLGEPYQDEGSASKYQRKGRPDFDRLLADLEAGRFPGQGLALWEASRGTRKVSEMARLLELCEERGIFVYVWNLGRAFDPRRVRDWAELMEEALDAEKESRKTSERVRRSSRADAAEGSFKGGRRPYGYEPDGVTIRRSEAEVIERCVEQLLSGWTIRAIAAQLNRDGIPTASGKTWHPGSLRKLLQNPRLAGTRTHRGAPVKTNAWPHIVDELTHRRVLAAIAGASVERGRRGPSPWLLSGLLRCGRCGAGLVSQADHREPHTRRYICRQGPGYHGCGKLGIKADPLEELLGDLATERLADIEARRAAGSSALPDERPELEELDRIALARRELSEDKAAGRISRATAIEDAAALDRLQREAELRLAAKVREASAMLPLDLVAGQGGRRWAELDREEQRARLRALITPVANGEGGIEVRPASRRGSTVFEAERVAAPGLIDWRV